MKKWLMLIMLIIIFSLCMPLKGQEKQPQKVVKVLKTEKPVKIDGVLDEPVWKINGYSGFTQSQPEDGKPATEKTKVWVAYDQEAIYVAAKMYDKNPDKLISLLGRRDDFTESEWFVFYLDPYYDRRSGFQFAVNPSGSICDWSLYNDQFRDISWDGIWECATKIDRQGWTVEIKIPFDQLRFKKKESEYIWGVNFRRYIKHKNEIVTFAWKPVTESGLVSFFARLEGIKGIIPKRYIEVVPYTIGKAAFGSKEEGNPFQTGENYSADFGIDIKVGLQSNLTLDLTANPDFGQVEVDPAVINLSAAESYYSEKRPFFVKDGSIFKFGIGGTGMHIGANWGNPRLFYSRRIGRSPQGYVDTDGYVSYPEWSTILAASKITGKIGKNNGWSIGVLSAFTEREMAEVDLDKARSTHEVEPFTNYNVVRMQKEFNEGKQGIGFITTSVFRNLPNENLQNLLNKNAFSFALDGWTALDKKKIWVVTGWLAGTRVTGSQGKIWDLQHSYPHYFQRPDATHLTLNENATSMDGWSGRFQLVKHTGNFIFNTALGMISPGFDSTDLGFQWSGDLINGHIMLGYQYFKPGKIFRNWQLLLFTQRNYDFGGDLIGEQRLIAIVDATLKNYLQFYFQLSHNPERYDKHLTRGGPLALSPTYTWMDFGINTDGRKPLVLNVGGYYLKSVSKTYTNSIYMNLLWKPSSNFNITLNPRYDHNNDLAQWVTKVEDPLMTQTYGNRYIFGNIQQKTLSCSIRFNWIFTPKLSLQAYIQPFIAVGEYNNFKELSKAKSFNFNTFGENVSTISFTDDTYTVDPDGAGPACPFTFDNPDFNLKSLRGTIVLRWEYRPGSTLYLVWTQNRADYANPGDFELGRDFTNLIKAPGDNIFMVKFTYRFKI